MNRYDDKSEKKEINSPHKDLDDNVEWFKKIMGRINWLDGNPIRYEINDTVNDIVFNPTKGKDGQNETVARVKEYRSVVFLKYELAEGTYKVSNTWVVSFHQPSRKSDRATGFRDELCNVLNYFGSQGWLEHKLKHNDGRWRNQADAPKDQWSPFGLK